MIELVIASVWQLKKMNDACNNDEKARAQMLKAYNTHANIALKVEEHKRQADQSLKKVVNRKKAILSVNMNRFLKVYQQIQAIDFRPGDGILELESESLAPAYVDSIGGMIVTSIRPMTEKESLRTYLLKGLGEAIYADSKRNLEIANSQLRIARVEKEQGNTFIVAIDAIRSRADQMATLLAKAGAAFNQSIRATDRTIEKNGTNRNGYSKEDREILMTCVNFASMVKALLDAPLLESNGSLTNESLLAIQDGQQRLDELKKRMEA